MDSRKTDAGVTEHGTAKRRHSSLLDAIERLGNRLPDPATLFVLGTIGVFLLSGLAAHLEWEVENLRPRAVLDMNDTPVLDADGVQAVEWAVAGEPYRPNDLLTTDGVYWLLQTMVKNFTGFAPLGVVLVGMLGIGLAEKVGLISALLRGILTKCPNALLTPTMVFAGIMSSITLDAGYVVLPPLAAALYKAVGRPPLAGLAAVVCGVAAGFNANLFVTGLDPMLAGFTAEGAQVLAPDYQVAATCNLTFMRVSTIVMTLVGWFVTEVFVERRLRSRPPEEGGPTPRDESALASQQLSCEERRGLAVAGLVAALLTALVVAMVLIPGWPLHGKDPAPPHFDRWVVGIVPILFFAFLVPGIGFGIAAGRVRSDGQVAASLNESIAAMAPIIVLAFFAAQFISVFSHSGLDAMLASYGGQVLGQSGLSKGLLLVGFIATTMVFNLFVGSMSAKYAVFAPIFVPMFMVVGISPELTQASYRIGDSVTNIVTPMNPYMIVILVAIRQYVPKAGMGSIVVMMTPYMVFLTIAWIALLVMWLTFGWDLGPAGPLEYSAGSE